MRRSSIAPTFLVLLAVAAGCGPVLDMPDMDRVTKQSHLMRQLMKDQDCPEWYKQREQIVQAMGDRVFDKDFDEVFDAMIVALGGLGVQVANMERQSGYIAGHGNLLPPDLTKPLRREQLVARCKMLGQDPGLLDVKGKYDMDPDMIGGMMQNMTGLTLQLIKQGPKQTKVKLRITNAYYPPYVEECYKALWPALDKQIFLNKGTD